MIILLYACAQQGAPSGGPVDKEPPLILSSYPKMKETNVPTQLQKAQINFNEYVLIKNVNNIFISPSLPIKPVYTPTTAPRKHIEIEFKSPLKDSTTYQIYFGNNIVDNNEGNALSNYSYVFSTSNVLDTLQIKGTIKGDSKIDYKKVLVGLYIHKQGEYKDSIPLLRQPDYIGSVDSIGNYQIDYIKRGEYKIIAFEDIISNLQYDGKREKIGFAKSVVKVPTKESIDLVMFEEEIEYKPISASQIGYGAVKILFKGDATHAEVGVIGNEIDNFYIERTQRKDSVVLWYNPEQEINLQDKTASVALSIKNKKHIDTLQFIHKKSKKGDLRIDMKPHDQSILSSVVLKSNIPIDKVKEDAISIFSDGEFIKHSIISENKKEIVIDFPKQWNRVYEINILPGGITDIYSNKNDSVNISLKMAKQQNYGSILFKLKNETQKPVILEVISKKDKQEELVEQVYLVKDIDNYKINNLLAGDYKVRVLIDENEDGRWNSGDFIKQKYPERIIEIEDIISVRSLWEIEQEISIF